MIVFKQKGDFHNTERFLNHTAKANYFNVLRKYGQAGVQALSSATPIDSGSTSSSWDYQIRIYKGFAKIVFTNSNIVDGVPVAILLQYGHGTKNGGYVQGRDYINPAIQPIFDKIAEESWKEVTSS